MTWEKPLKKTSMMKKREERTNLNIAIPRTNINKAGIYSHIHSVHHIRDQLTEEHMQWDGWREKDKCNNVQSKLVS